MEFSLYLLIFLKFLIGLECQNRSGHWRSAYSSSTWDRPSVRRQPESVPSNYVASWARPRDINSRAQSSPPPVGQNIGRRRIVNSASNSRRSFPAPGVNQNRNYSHSSQSERDPPTRSDANQLQTSATIPSWSRSYSANSWSRPAPQRPESIPSTDPVSNWARPRDINSRAQSSPPPVGQNFGRRRIVNSASNSGRSFPAPGVNQNRYFSHSSQSERDPPTRSDANQLQTSATIPSWSRSYSENGRSRPASQRPESIPSTDPVSNWARPRDINSRAQSSPPPVGQNFGRRRIVNSASNSRRSFPAPGVNQNRNYSHSSQSERDPPTRSDANQLQTSATIPSWSRSYSENSRSRPASQRPESIPSTNPVSNWARPRNSRRESSTSPPVGRYSNTARNVTSWSNSRRSSRGRSDVSYNSPR